MFVYGISNRLDATHNLFFYEFDNTSIEDVITEAIRLGDFGGIDIIILESSKNSYHLVSFDVLLKKDVERLCSYVSLPSDFVHMNEQKLLGNPYEDNCLRLGRKFKKQNPKYLYTFLQPHNDNYKAINHYMTYNAFCGVRVPLIPEFLKIPYRVYFVIYNTGTPRKKWFGGCKRKEYSKL